jgi:hypothetical protein
MTLDEVVVLKTHLVPGRKGHAGPTADGTIFQIIQAGAILASPARRSRTPPTS